MKNDRIEGNWQQLKGKVLQRWGKLTDYDMDRIDRSRRKLIRVIQSEYGKTLEELERELDECVKQ